MVLASWSLDGLDDGHKDAGKGKDPGNGHGAGKGKDAPGDSRQERFNRIAGPALDRLNLQRREHGEHDLQQLPPEEEERIWRQVDEGAGAGGGDGGHAKQTPIRNWHDLGAALQNDAVDMIGSSFGMDVAELSRDGKDGAKPGDHQPGDHKGHDDQHKKIEPDDIDLDELGHRIYDRIRSRLRLELLLDRERAGLLSDFR
jgi:hypothetical protein